MSEFAFIERIRARLAQNPFSAPDLLLGIGDDTAILRETTGRELLITTDLLVEDIDFKLAYIPPACIFSLSPHIDFYESLITGL